MPTDNDEHQPTLLDRINNLPPELGELIWRSLMQQSEQPVRLNGTYELGHDPGGWRPCAYSGFLPTHQNPVLEDLITPIIAGLKNHGASEGVIDRARKDFFSYNTFHASTHLIGKESSFPPFSSSFATQYAPHVQALEFEEYACVADHYTPEDNYPTVYIEEYAEAIRLMKSPWKKDLGMKMPQLSRLTIHMSDGQCSFGWAQGAIIQGPIFISDGINKTCSLFRPQYKFLATARSLLEPLLKKHKLDWIRLKWFVDCQHEDCPMRNTEQYAKVSSFKGFERKGDWCSVLIGERALTLQERRTRVLKYVHGTRAAPARKGAMRTIMAAHLAVTSQVVAKGGRVGCR